MRSQTRSHQSRGGFGVRGISKTDLVALRIPFPTWQKCRINPTLARRAGASIFTSKGAEYYRCYAALAKPIACYSLDELMEVLSIRTRPATRLVLAVGSRLKQFHKDHYFPFQDVLQLNKILLRSLPCCVAQAAAALIVQLKMN